MNNINLSKNLSLEVFESPGFKNNFDDMFDLCPKDRHKVQLKDCDIEVHRYQKSYLNTPRIDTLLNTEPGGYKWQSSYMFSGMDDSQNNDDLPEIFKPYLDYMNSTFTDCNFNQVSVNWYKDGNDYIAFHRDCEIGMTGNKKIGIMTFNENPDECRELIFKLSNPIPEGEFFEKEVSVPLKNGSVILISTDVQKYYKHGIRKSDTTSKRISLSFRQFN